MRTELSGPGPGGIFYGGKKLEKSHVLLRDFFQRFAEARTGRSARQKFVSPLSSLGLGFFFSFRANVLFSWFFIGLFLGFDPFTWDSMGMLKPFE